MPSSSESPSARSAPGRVALSALYLIFLMALAEGFSFLAGRLLESRWCMYRDPAPPEHKRALPYETYLSVRDPVLGWPRAQEFGEAYAPEGSRWCRGSGVDAQAPSEVALYGDSYTADWVGGDSDHWGCRLERRLSRRVRNFGVGGYGTDQALLRYRKNAADAARVVVLAHMSEDIERNLTRYRDFQSGSRDWAFKPRFVLDADGELELLPLPSVPVDDYDRFLALELPQLVLEHELFHPNGPAGAVRLRFPYSWALVRNLGYFGLRSRLARVPSYAPFYAPDHPFRGVELTAKIMLSFGKEAEARGQKSLLVVFPGRADLEGFRATGRWYYQPLLDELQRRGVTPLNFGDVLIAHLAERPVDEAFGSGGVAEEAHYNQEMSHLVADTLAERLTASGLLDERQPPEPGRRPALRSRSRGTYSLLGEDQRR